MRSWLLVLLLVACTTPSPLLDAGLANDASRDDVGTEADGGGLDDAGTRADAASACGNGAVDDGEVCDGATMACGALAGSWNGGDASCRADCSGWDVSSCTLRMAGAYEMVEPAAREPARWGGAVCNDGTPFGFYIRLAPVPTTRWVIHLEGGVFCDDDALSCADRLRDSPELTTESGLEDRSVGMLPFSGLFSPDAATNPAFATANVVKASYCSSDFWSGEGSERRPTSADPAGWFFAGRTNVSAMLDILAERYGLSDADPDTTVLWGGSSAGAFGAQFNVPRIREELPSAFADGRVSYFGDAPWMIDYDDPAHRAGAATVRDREVWRAALAFWGGRVNEDCEATVEDPVDCWFGLGWYPIVSAQMPVFVQQSEIDGSFGTFLHGFGPCSPAGVCPDPDDQATIDAWRAQLVSSLAGVSWLFSGSTRYHTLAMVEATFTTGPPGSTLREALGRFWAGAPPERITF